jgi:hypothetical protein
MHVRHRECTSHQLVLYHIAGHREGHGHHWSRTLKSQHGLNKLAGARLNGALIGQAPS